jgi:hypothetical protein
MRLIGNGTKLRLILGGGERLDGRALRLQSFSATAYKSNLPVDKSGRASGAAGLSLRLAVCWGGHFVLAVAKLGGDDDCVVHEAHEVGTFDRFIFSLAKIFTEKALTRRFNLAEGVGWISSREYSVSPWITE